MIDAALEARLVDELRTGGERARAAALSELFEHLGRPLYQVCLRVACDPSDAEDARQETFVEVLRALESFRGEARLSTWIFRIAIRAALRARSRRGAPRALDFASLDADQLESLRSDGRSADPTTPSLERESAARILTAIARLPAPQRAVLALAALDDLPRAEVAAILGIPIGTVDSRLNAARERLRDELTR